MNIILYLLVLPAISALVFANSTTTFRELWVSKVSIVLMTLGALTLSVSATPALMILGLVIYTLGTGFPPIVRSLVTSVVKSHHASTTSDIARLYTTIAVVEGIGSLVTGPAMAFTFRAGMSLGGGAWLGIPFLVITLLFGSTAVVMFWIKV